MSSNLFLRKNINKYTWTTRNGKYQRQIEHVMVDDVHRSSISEMKLKKGTDGDSYHFMVLTKISLRIKNHQKKERKQSNIRFNVDKLRDESILRRFYFRIKDTLDNNAKQEEPDIQFTWY